MNRDELRAALLAEDDIVIKPVPTPEWPSVDGHLYVRTMSAAQREVYLDSIREIGPVPNKENELDVKVFLQAAGVKLVAATMCDKDGDLLWTHDDLTILGHKSWQPIERAQIISAELNGLRTKAKEVAKNDSSSAVISNLATV